MMTLKSAAEKFHLNENTEVLYNKETNTLSIEVAKPYIIIGIMGKSASGKNTILQTLKNYLDLDWVNNIKSKTNFPKETTTRSKRAKETDEDYDFISDISSDTKWLCTSFYNGEWFYGIPESNLDKNKVNVMILNAQYYKQLSERPDVILNTIYLDVTNEILEERQVERLLKSVNSIQDVKDFIDIYDKRIKQDKIDYDDNQRKYDDVFPNNNCYDSARNVNCISAIIEALSKKL